MAIYAAALKLAEGIFFFSKQFTNLLAPVFAEIKGAGDKETSKYVLLLTVKYACLPALTLSLPFIIFAPEFLNLWLGANFVQAKSLILLLLVANFFVLAHAPGSAFLAMTGYHFLNARLALLAASTNLILSLILITLWGLNGVALATLIAALAIDFLVISWFAYQKAHLAYRQLFTTALYPLLIPFLTDLFLLLVLRRVFYLNTGLALLGICFSSLLCLVVFWFVSVPNAEKRLLKERIMQRT